MEFSASPLPKGVSTSVAVAFNSGYLSVGNTDMGLASDALFIIALFTDSTATTPTSCETISTLIVVDAGTDLIDDVEKYTLA